jgi:SAM-dependent methyltransferase
MDARDLSQTLHSWNQVARLYQEKFAGLHLYDEGYDAFCRLLTQKRARLLELGCGPGNLTQALLNRRPDFQILGLDGAPEMLRIARELVSDARFELADVRDLSAYPGPFDGIVSGFCIPYLSPEELPRHISDLSGRLDTDGILYLSFLEGDPANSGWVHGSTGHAMEFFYFQKSFMRNLLAVNNLLVEMEMDFPFPRQENVEIHSLLLARKA